MQLFEPSGPLEFVAINILGHSTEMRQDNRLVVVMIDRYGELTREMPTINLPAPKIASIFLEHWIIFYGIYKTVLLDNGPQFVSIILLSMFFSSVIFAALCAS